jgi:zinc protease
MSTRFDLPGVGTPTPVRFPSITRETLTNGLKVWVIPQATVPIAAALLVVTRGTADDPAGRHGLASLTADLVDEGAGSRDAIELSDALARLGTQLDIDTAPDATSIGLTVLGRFIEPSLELLADVVMRPHLADADFARVRELRVNRLRQLSQSAGTIADRTFVSAIFGSHPYGHGALGTTNSLSAITPDDAREFWSRHYSPADATLIVSGPVEPQGIVAAAARWLGAWRQPVSAAATIGVPSYPPDPRVLLVNRSGAPQCEVRVGHRGPARATDAYHALVTLNAALGGQFTSRINRKLREEKGLTYGARTAFEFRRVSGAFTCDTSVQADGTATAVSDILEEFEHARRETAFPPAELALAKASLTRGYIRNFETAGQLARAASQLAVYALDADAFDRFVPHIEALTVGDIHDAAETFLRPDESTIVVVGDAQQVGPTLGRIGREVVAASPEF